MPRAATSSARALRGQQRPGRIGDLHHQPPVRRRALAKHPDVFRQQRIEISRQPVRGLASQALASFRRRDDFGPSVQEN